MPWKMQQKKKTDFSNALTFGVQYDPTNNHTFTLISLINYKIKDKKYRNIYRQMWIINNK